LQIYKNYHLVIEELVLLNVG